MRRDRGRRCGRVSPPNDLIKGAFNRSALGTVVERKTRYRILSSSSGKQAVRGADCSAERAVAPPKRRWKASPGRWCGRTVAPVDPRKPPEPLPAVLRRSMTPDRVRGRLYDRGSEMACHPEFARRRKIDI